MQNSLTLVAILLIITLPVRSQSAKNEFDRQKKWVDSLVYCIDTSASLAKGIFTGKEPEGEYKATCFYNKKSKEIIKTVYVFTRDSVGTKTAYYQGSNLIKIIDKSVPYYLARQKVWNEQGKAANNDAVRSVLGILDDTLLMFQRLIMFR